MLNEMPLNAYVWQA